MTACSIWPRRRSIPSMPMAFYRNSGDGTFEERTEAAGLIEQLGGKNLVQTDFNNDGHMDLFISRGAWLNSPIRQCLAAEQRRRHVHRRDRSRRGCSTRSIPPIRAGLITTTTAGSTSTSSASSRPTACITTEATEPSRKSAPGPAWQATRRRSARVPTGSTTTTTIIPTCSSTT